MRPKSIMRGESHAGDRPKYSARVRPSFFLSGTLSFPASADSNAKRLIAGLLSSLVLLAPGCDAKKTEPQPPPIASASSTAATTTTVAATPVVPATVPPSSAAAAPSAVSSASSPPVAELPLDIQVPASVGQDKRPLLILLHGLGNTGKSVIKFLDIPTIAADKRFVYAAPEGATSSLKAQYWNASKACCDFDGTNLDHVGMLRRAIEKAKRHPNVDASHVYVAGFSNGGFFAHRAACEIEGIAAVASIAGAGPAEGEICTPKGPVRILEIHGDADKSVRFDGGRVLDKPSVPVHPGARATMDGWATRNGCKGAPVAAGTIDFEAKIEGPETTVLRYPGCRAPVELWTVKGGSHYLASSRQGVEAVWAYLDRGNGK